MKQDKLGLVCFTTKYRQIPLDDLDLMITDAMH